MQTGSSHAPTHFLDMSEALQFLTVHLWEVSWQTAWPVLAFCSLVARRLTQHLQHTVIGLGKIMHHVKSGRLLENVIIFGIYTCGSSENRPPGEKKQKLLSPHTWTNETEVSSSSDQARLNQLVKWLIHWLHMHAEWVFWVSIFLVTKHSWVVTELAEAQTYMLWICFNNGNYLSDIISINTFIKH